MNLPIVFTIIVFFIAEMLILKKIHLLFSSQASGDFTSVNGKKGLTGVNRLSFPGVNCKG